MRKIVCWSIGFGKGRKDRLCGVAVTTDEDDMCVALGVASELSLTFRRQIWRQVFEATRVRRWKRGWLPVTRTWSNCIDVVRATAWKIIKTHTRKLIYK